MSLLQEIQNDATAHSVPLADVLPPVPQTVCRRQWLFRKVTAPHNAPKGAPQQIFSRRADAEAKCEVVG